MLYSLSPFNLMQHSLCLYNNMLFIKILDNMVLHVAVENEKFN